MTSVLGAGAQAAEQQKLMAADAAAFDQLGQSMAMSGQTLVVGAPGDDDAKGSVRVFIRSDGGWTEQQTLTASDGAVGKAFGAAVAISGDIVVVGAPGDDDGEGAVYVFVGRDGIWTEQQKLIACDGVVNDLFGNSVALNGQTLVVGGFGDDGRQGSAYVFIQRGGVWTEQQKLTASDALPSDMFGRAVTVDGDTIVVGSPREGFGGPTPPGSAYVFVRRDGVWIERQKLTASDGTQTDSFGFQFSLSGETLVVSAAGADSDRGAIYVFVRSDDIWSERQKLSASDRVAGDRFGRGIALSGTTLVVGATADDAGPNTNQGSAYVFGLSDGAWTEQQKLTASDGVAGNLFGTSVALGGGSIVVSAPLDNVGGNQFQGSVHVFSPSFAAGAREARARY
jgi:hypothetical protein